MGQKWLILQRVLPLTAIFCLAKWGIHKLGWEIWAFDSMTSSLFAATTLIIAFMLSGTLADYRESENLPTEVCNAIESIQDTNLLVAAGHAEYNPKPLLAALIDLLKQTRDRLQKEDDINPILEEIASLNQAFVPLEKYASPPWIGRVQAEQSKLRVVIVKIQRIRDTSFVVSAYTILEIFTPGIAIALLLIRSTNFIESLLESGFLFTIVVYLVLFIRDLDNPFNYQEKSGADVSLWSLDSAIERLEKQL
jgi:hypothetical protein